MVSARSNEIAQTRLAPTVDRIEEAALSGVSGDGCSPLRGPMDGNPDAAKTDWTAHPICCLNTPYKNSSPLCEVVRFVLACVVRGHYTAPRLGQRKFRIFGLPLSDNVAEW